VSQGRLKEMRFSTLETGRGVAAGEGVGTTSARRAGLDNGLKGPWPREPARAPGPHLYSGATISHQWPIAVGCVKNA
jgi:hypothetical protein